MRAHRQKEPLVPLMSKGSKGQQKFETFGDHVDALCSGMRVSYSVPEVSGV